MTTEEDSCCIDPKTLESNNIASGTGAESAVSQDAAAAVPEQNLKESDGNPSVSNPPQIPSRSSPSHTATAAPEQNLQESNEPASVSSPPQIPSRSSPSHALTATSSSSSSSAVAAVSEPSASEESKIPPAATAAAATAEEGTSSPPADEKPVYDGPEFVLQIDGETGGRPVVMGGSDVTGFAVLYPGRVRKFAVDRIDYVEVCMYCKISQSRFSKSRIVLAVQRIPVSPFMKQCMFSEDETKFDFALATRPESPGSFFGTKTSFARDYSIVGRLIAGEKECLAEVEREIWLLPIVDALNTKMHPPGFPEQPAVAVTKHFTWSLTKHGKIHMTASLPQKAYCTGEELAVTISVDNLSNVRVEGVFLQISQFLWKKGSKKAVNEDAVLTSSNVLEHSPMAPRTIVPRGGASFTVKITMPSMDGITPAWSYGEMQVSHGLKILLSPSKDFKSKDFVVQAYLSFLLASCRGIPHCVKHTYTYDKAVAYTKAESPYDVDSPYVMYMAQRYEEMAAGGSAQNGQDDLSSQQALIPTPQDDEPEAEQAATGGGTREESLCVVCQERVQTHCIVPCGHKCLCVSCAKLFLKTSLCPICRGKVNTIIRVYNV